MTERLIPGLEALDGLVGGWDTEATHPMLPGAVVGGHSVFEWLDGERFLIARSHMDHPDVPDSISVIGDTEGLRMHYFDSRGVSRIYDMSYAHHVWKMSREAAGPDAFGQRFEWSLSSDRNIIDGRSELCHDGETWQEDLLITYRRTSGPVSA